MFNYNSKAQLAFAILFVSLFSMPSGFSPSSYKSKLSQINIGKEPIAKVSVRSSQILPLQITRAGEEGIHKTNPLVPDRNGIHHLKDKEDLL